MTPYDQYGRVQRTDASVTALARNVCSSLSSSTEITLNTNTKIVRIAAIDKDVYLKWGIDECAVHTFDDIIVAGTVVDFAIPLQADGTKYTALNLLQRTATAIAIVIEK